MFVRAIGSTDEENEAWHRAMYRLLQTVPDDIIVTVLIAEVGGPGRVVVCDCCEQCAAEMVLGAASEVEEVDGDERPGFSPEERTHHQH